MDFKKGLIFLMFIVLSTSFVFALEEFCGVSTGGTCLSNSDCKTGGCSGQVCENTSQSTTTTCDMKECYRSTGKECTCAENKCKWMPISNDQNKTKNTKSYCPENCTCSGSTMKCIIKGQREMTIIAGKSGNTIVQVKGENMSTNVTLTYSTKEGKVYRIMKNNQTKRIKILPDQIREKLEKKFRQRNESYNITLNEDGTYLVQTEKRARLFFLFPMKEKVVVKIDSETGDIIKTKTSWWGFFARDKKDKELIGSSCGTVTPGYNDECCQNKGYDVWNSEKVECAFNPEE